MSTLTPLQMSALAFFTPCAALAHAAGERVMFTCMVFVLCTSMYVHRAKRTDKPDVVDSLDHAAICAWIAAVVELTVRVDITTWRGKEHIAMTITCALAVIALNVLRVYVGVWQSPRRQLAHAIMHCVGVIGTLVLLSAPLSRSFHSVVF